MSHKHYQQSMGQRNIQLTVDHVQPCTPVVSRSQTHPTASEGKGLGTCYTTTCSSVLSSF